MTRRAVKAPPLPSPRDRRWFRTRLLAWYRRHGRDLPWRKTDDPYHILVSEIMLQQTQVDRVLPKYGEWLQKYPTLRVLADAEENDVRSTWYPLGYNIRPRRLQAIAREAVARFGGTLPEDEDTLLSFKGIGAYTAGAIRSFAFGHRAAILDTNVARVLSRIFLGPHGLGKQQQRVQEKGAARPTRTSTKDGATRRHLWRMSEALMPRKDVFDFNQALMDFGAVMCSARNPKCETCPMAADCRSYPFTATTARRINSERHGRPRR